MYSLSIQKQFLQEKFFPIVEEQYGVLSTKEKEILSILEAIKVEKLIFYPVKRVGKCHSCGGRNLDRVELARCFVAKSLFNMEETKAFREMLKKNDVIRKAIGWDYIAEIPSESKFSRVFSYFAEIELPNIIHNFIIEKYIPKTAIIGHVSYDGSAIEAREKVYKKEKKKKIKKKRGRPKKGEKRETAEKKRLEKQKEMSLEQMLEDLPKKCDYNSKINSKGISAPWKGYKLHVGWSDEGIPVCSVLTSASLHDSQAALPLIEMADNRVTSLYDLMDSAYDSKIIIEYSKSKNHVPIIDKNPRRKYKIEFTDPERIRYKERTTAERGFSEFVVIPSHEGIWKGPGSCFHRNDT